MILLGFHAVHSQWSFQKECFCSRGLAKTSLSCCHHLPSVEPWIKSHKLSSILHARFKHGCAVLITPLWEFSEFMNNKVFFTVGGTRQIPLLWLSSSCIRKPPPPGPPNSTISDVIKNVTGEKTPFLSIIELEVYSRGCALPLTFTLC